MALLQVSLVADELAQWLSDDTPRTIVIDKTYKFTGR
jgi:hypothetical protein